MKRIFYSLVVAAALMQSCATNESTVERTAPTKEVMNRSDIDKIIWNQIRQTGKFEWSSVSNDVIFSALKQSDFVLSVGFKPENENSNLKDNIHTINIHEGNWKSAKEQILQLIFEEERKVNPNLKREQLEVFKEDILPVVNVLVQNPATLERLRQSKLVRYAEPMGYEPNTGAGENPANRTESSSGCDGNDATSGLVAGSDYKVVAPNAKASWNHAYHNVEQAWANSTGAGTKVMIIDTGISYNQENFNTAFNQGYSTGRTIERLVTLPQDTFLGFPIGSPETPNDACGHGTSMAGVLAAPRGTDGNSAGIAYNCNLVTVRAASDVFLDASREVKGVSDAYTLAGNRSDIKIISMSLGRMTSSSQIQDAVRYAYNRGKLIFCAGGTSFSWASGWWGVIFPAWMPEVNAVTGVKESLVHCDDCHEGSEIDFIVVMEKNSTGLHPLTTANYGDVPATVGGSSVSTAQTAGMAALVWSKYPTYTRDQVLEKLKTSASYYPNRHGNFGWGAVNVEKALR